MTTEKMTIHKALVELKTLDGRISKAIKDTTFVVSNPQSSQKVNGISIADYSASVKSKYQQIQDLIARRNAIKCAVVLSNATTKVVIAGKEYTVAEAIEMKNHGLGFTKELISKIHNDYIRAAHTANQSNGDALTNRADAYIGSLFANADLRNPSVEIAEARRKYIEAQTLILVDPIQAQSVIEELQSTVDAFLVEVDAALSVSNAITQIEVTY